MLVAEPIKKSNLSAEKTARTPCYHLDVVAHDFHTHSPCVVQTFHRALHIKWDKHKWPLKLEVSKYLHRECSSLKLWVTW